MNGKVIRVWDMPVRIFHWLLVLLIFGAIITIKMGGNAVVWHGRIGQLVVALIAFRIVWGFTGSTYARFVNFVRGPKPILDYLGGRWHGAGHNPLGALSVLALLALMGFQAVSGLFTTDSIAFQGPLYRAVSRDTSEMILGWHKLAEWPIYLLIALHIGSVIFYALVKKKDLVMPMFTGKMVVPEDSHDESARGGSMVALIVAIVIAAAVWWIAGGGLLEPPPPPPPPAPDMGW